MKEIKSRLGKPGGPALQILAAGIVWLGSFSSRLRLGGGGLTVFLTSRRTPTANAEILLTEGSEGRVDKMKSPPTAQSCSPAGARGARGTDAQLHWAGSAWRAALRKPDIGQRHALPPGGILFDDITWNFSGWELLRPACPCFC